ncbi:nucleotide exchange factor GrpE [Elusimicrobiota bacterium]
MSKKEHREKKEEKHDSKEIEQLKKEAHEKQETEDLYLEQLKRLKAEFDNYRKRMECKLADNIEFGRKNVAGDLLVVLDNLQRALDSEQIDPAGIDLVSREFYNILKNKGLKRMDADGKKFDHNLHHAISSHEVDDDEKDGNIIEVIQPGYFWKDEVLRPAMVIVASTKEEKDKV